MNRLLFLLFLFPALPVFSQDTATGILLSDSTYRRVVINGQDSLNCHLSYPQEQPEVSLKAEEANSERIREERRKFVLPVGIKTNLVSWAGITPEFEHATFMPNLAAEAFFLKRFSAELSVVFSNFSFGSGKFWGVSGYSLEPRFWLKEDGHYKGFYFGVYGQAGEFDVRRPEKGTASNHTGTYFDAGVSAGYYLPLTKHLGAEFGLRGGFHSANSQSYYVRGNINYLEGTDDANRFGLTRINVSLSYRF